MNRFLPEAFVDGGEWMALRQLAFGACAGAVPTKKRLVSLGLIETEAGRVEVSAAGFAKLALGRD